MPSVTNLERERYLFPREDFRYRVSERAKRTNFLQHKTQKERSRRTYIYRYAILLMSFSSAVLSKFSDNHRFRVVSVLLENFLARSFFVVVARIQQ